MQDVKRKVFAWVVRRRVPIIVLFVLAAVICLGLRNLVAVDYDMNNYLPSESASTVALDTMDAEFSGGVPNARVMLRDVSVAQALDYKQQIAEVDGVSDVIWLDDSLDTAIPLEMQKSNTVDTYYRDGSVLFKVTIDDSKRMQAVSDIRAIIGPDNAMDGSAVSSAVATESTVSEIARIAAIVIAFILLILILTTTSWLEPLLILAGLGVAAAINAGSNLMFGTISFVTNAAGSVLQIAISLDFAVFLLHRYTECRGTTPSTAEDMVEALCKSSTAIFSSALTVMVGFLALTVMKFGIGPDLGFALAKGIAISLVVMFTFMPALLVCAEKLIQRTTHRPLIPSFARFAKVVSYVMLPALFVFALLPIPSYLASTSTDIDYWYGSSHIFSTSTQVGQDSQAIKEVFGQNDTYVLLVPEGDIAAEQNLSAALHGIEQVTDVVSYVDSVGAEIPQQMVPAATLSKLESGQYSRMVVSVNAPLEGSETFDFVQKVRDTAQTYFPDTYLLAGEGVSTTDLMSTIQEDKDVVDAIAIAAVFIVLLLATRSISLPIILVLLIETTIWFNFAVPYFTGESEFYIAYLICSAIQLGVTVDYAILLSDRYLEERQTQPKRQAISATLTSVTVPILTSSTTIIVCGFLLYGMTSHGVLSQLGFYLGKGVLFSLIAVLFVLPAALYLCDGIIRKTTKGTHFFEEGKPLSTTSKYQLPSN